MKNIILFLGITLLLSSCEEYLDVKPVGKLIPTEIEEYDNLLNNTSTIKGMFISNNGHSMLSALSDNVFMSENVVKYYYNSSSGLLNWLSAYSFYSPLNDHSTSDRTLDNGYEAIGIYNNVIDGVYSLGKENDEYGMQVIAQAKAARAWTYLVLGVSYGPMFNPSGTNASKCIPYRIDGDVTKPNPELATTQELFEKVEVDLAYAIEHCPDEVVNPVRASKATAMALMGYMYMFKGDFDNMYKYSESAWNTLVQGKGVDNLIYNYNEFSYIDKTVTVNPGVDKETRLFLATPDQLHEQTYHRENLFYREPAYRSYSLQLSPEYLGLFDIVNDRRYNLFILNDDGFAKNVTGVGYVSDGIVKTHYKTKKMLTNHGLTNPELLLMLAESAARIGKIVEAQSALEVFRHYRYVNAGTVSLSGDALIQEILNERRRELPIETPQRYWDIKRLAFDSGKTWAKQNLTRTILGNEFKMDIKSEQFNLTIGNAYRAYNPSWGLDPISSSWTPYSQFE